VLGDGVRAVSVRTFSRDTRHTSAQQAAAAAAGVIVYSTLGQSLVVIVVVVSYRRAAYSKEEKIALLTQRRLRYVQNLHVNAMSSNDVQSENLNVMLFNTINIFHIKHFFLTHCRRLNLINAFMYRLFCLRIHS